MNTKHTPGPWHIVDAVNSDWPNGCEVCIDNVEGGNPETDYCIASAVHGDPEELMANARLISAAPELLEALKNLLEVIKGQKPGSFSDAEKQALAAISKAKGGVA